jgi:hypothetical protein
VPPLTFRRTCIAGAERRMTLGDEVTFAESGYRSR